MRDRIAVYASSVFTEEGSAAHQVELVAPLLERGVRMAKVRIGPDWQRGLEVLTELRSLLDPAVELMVDGSEIFTLPTALHVAQRLHELGIMWFEEPIPQNERAGIEELARKSPVPIAYGEHLFGREDALDALRHGQLSILQPDASTCGGISEARKMAELASFYGARVVHTCARGRFHWQPISILPHRCRQSEPSNTPSCSHPPGPRSARARTLARTRSSMARSPYRRAPAWESHSTKRR